MKFFAFRQGDRRRLGYFDGSAPRDLSSALDAAGVVESEHDLLRNDFFRPQRITAFLKRFKRFAPKIDGEIVYLPPVLPNKVLAVGRNFAEHARELGNPVEEELLFFAKLTESISAHGAPIVVPRHLDRVDHEAELAIIISRDGKDIAPAKAFSHVAGYTCLVDVTAREEQGADKARKRPWTRSKSYDSFCPIGPVWVPMDDITNPQSLQIVCRVNGEVKQSGNTADWVHSIPKMISYISRHTTLRAGDVIATGTPPGVGPLKPGDAVEVEIDKIGILKNPVVWKEEPAPYDKQTALAELFPRIEAAIATSRDGGEAFERTIALIDTLQHCHWSGIYRVEPDGSLQLGPFRGKATEHVKIAPGKGICGRAIVNKESVLVDDVTKDPAYLACSIETRSEIVVPIFSAGMAVAEIDIDSDQPAAFDRRDREFFESVAKLLGDYLEKTHLPRMWDDR
ncbi:MAG: fumarylacetoacetate hydrolase family protein [Planctomycetes bacterium]|nr:fumarylacetoacetate hydrolase family protein [Planctomycetota bacterium]